MILLSNIGFSVMLDIVVRPRSTLDIALWVKSKMAAIIPRSNNKFMSFLTEWKHCRMILDFGGHHQVYALHIGVNKKNRYCIVGKIQNGQHFSKVKQ